MPYQYCQKKTQQQLQQMQQLTNIDFFSGKSRSKVKLNIKQFKLEQQNSKALSKIPYIPHISSTHTRSLSQTVYESFPQFNSHHSKRLSHQSTKQLKNNKSSSPIKPNKQAGKYLLFNPCLNNTQKHNLFNKSGKNNIANKFTNEKLVKDKLQSPLKRNQISTNTNGKKRNLNDQAEYIFMDSKKINKNQHYQIQTEFLKNKALVLNEKEKKYSKGNKDEKKIAAQQQTRNVRQSPDKCADNNAQLPRICTGTPQAPQSPLLAQSPKLERVRQAVSPDAKLATSLYKLKVEPGREYEMKLKMKKCQSEHKIKLMRYGSVKYRADKKESVANQFIRTNRLQFNRSQKKLPRLFRVNVVKRVTKNAVEECRLDRWEWDNECSETSYECEADMLHIQSQGWHYQSALKQHQSALKQHPALYSQSQQLKHNCNN